ncbi:MAG: carbohydrate ABC transporter permease [Clostridiales bacterium]|mgnify:FL=1|nr:carbohydrate ABC transporter permease [Clostridiales bacterium]HBM80208.1 carbohydrate ABC transporter permease [Clostridiaceae bacterium]
MKLNYSIKLSAEDHIINITCCVIAFIIFFITLYPIYYSFISSISDGQAAMATQIYFLPVKVTLENYKIVFSEKTLYNSYIVNILRTLIGTITGVFFTSMMAYGISRKELKFRKLYSIIAIITMYFGGGLIPYYLVLRYLHLINTFSVYIIPSLINVFNMLLFMSFFRDLPGAIIESAKIDGAGEFTIFRKIVIPLSKPVLATVALFVGVYHWNDWFTSAYFVTNEKLMTLPTILMRLVNSAEAQEKLNKMMLSSAGVNIGSMKTGPTVNSIRHATMLVSIVPIMMVYPFLQKYFVKGIMVGAIKA